MGGFCNESKRVISFVLVEMGRANQTHFFWVKNILFLLIIMMQKQLEKLCCSFNSYALIVHFR